MTLAIVSRCDPTDGPAAAAAAAFAPTTSAPFSSFWLSVSFFNRIPSMRRFPSRYPSISSE